MRRRSEWKPATSSARRAAAARSRSPASAALVACALALSGCGADTRDGSDGTGVRAERYTIPGERVFPEGIAVQKSTGDFFVGSTVDGAIYRGNVDRQAMELFLPGGAGGRTATTGMKVDRRGRLIVAGRFTGKVFVYDLASRRLIDTLAAPAGLPSFSPRAEPALVNDLTLTERAVYVTDSFRPVVYRIPASGDRLGPMEPWLDLEDTPVPYARGFNLNGISASDDGRYLVTVHSGTGELFRIDTRTRAVRRIDLGGASVKTGDGLLLDGRRLFVVREEPGEVVPVELSKDLLRGRVLPGLGRESLRFPTTIAERDGRLLVVDSQLDRATPELPFTVTALPVPGRAGPP